MKKYLLLLVFTFYISFFLFSPKVKADTTYNLTSTSFSHLSNLDTMKTTADTKLSELGSTYIGYILYVNEQPNSVYYALFFKAIPNIRYDLYLNNNMYIVYGNNFQSKWQFSNDFSSLSSATFNYEHPYISTLYGSYVLYSTHNLLPNAGAILNENVIYNYDDRTYQFLNDGTNYFPSLYELYTYFSTPPDNYPLLTSFFILVLEKIGYISNYISSSYICLSIFAIFILYFVILMFRRLT